jgi:hypothetical protein
MVKHHLTIKAMSKILEALSDADYERFTEIGIGKGRVFDPTQFEPNEYNNDSVALPYEIDDEVTDEIVFDSVTSDEQNCESDRYLIDLSKEYPEIEYTLKINGIVTFPKGNLQAIKAKAKNGKTHVNICLMTALLSGKFLAIESLIGSSKICYFATEEHENGVQENKIKIHQLCGWDTERNNDRFWVYAIREAETEERIEIIEDAIEMRKPDIVFIDGIRDLLIDFNNIKDSHTIITRLLNLSSKHNCAIVNVLHTNKAQSDYNMRGHLGTELLNKCSDVLEVTKNNDNFVVQHTDSRYKETGDWAFCFDEEDHLTAGEIKDKTKDKDERIAKMEQYFSEILTKDKILSYSELREKGTSKNSILFFSKF